MRKEGIWSGGFFDPIPSSVQGGWTDAFLFLCATAHPLHCRPSTPDWLEIGAQNIHMIKCWFIAFGVNETKGHQRQLSLADISFVEVYIVKTINEAQTGIWKSSDQTEIMDVN